ncbi:MAG: phosphopyruvate hydratase, partial [Actinobacteria bacterium]|nr:phosphopyruvate hydratase [Actinomycetota bacterium]
GDVDWYEGSGVKKAVNNINEKISDVLVGMNILEQESIDSALCKLDGTINKSNIGGNAIIATSLCVVKAAAASLKIPVYEYIRRYINEDNCICLPIPWLHIIGGGKHTGKGIDFQEIEIFPICSSSYKECFYIAWKVHRKALEIISKERCYNLVFSVCGGLAPIFKSNEDAIELLIRAIEEAGYTPGVDILVYIDVAASSFFLDNRYFLNLEKKVFSSMEMVDYIVSVTEKYPVCAIEDGLAQCDWKGWSELTRRIGERLMVVGDDIFVTNPDLLTRGVKKGVANAVIIKANQIGTITEALNTVKIARKANYKTIVSARSGESEDPILAHLAIGLGADGAKLGGLVGAESTARLNELIRIEEKLGNNAKYLWVNL